MRRLIACFVAACAVAVLAASGAPAKSGQGVMCVLHAKLSAKNETAGSIVVPLFVSPAPPTNARQIKQRGVATPNAGTTGADLCANPGAYYVNYHTTAFPRS